MSKDWRDDPFNIKTCEDHPGFNWSLEAGWGYCDGCAERSMGRLRL